MAISYTRMLALAQRLIAESGRPITLVKQSTVSADPTKPWKGPAVTANTELAATAVFLDPVTSRDWGFTEIQDDWLDHKADKIAMVAGVADAGSYDTIKDGSVIWKIMKVRTLETGPVTLIHQFYINR